MILIRFLPVLFAVLGFLFLISCTSPQKRADENAEAFAELTKEEQRAVLEGRIEEGMNEDAVYIALGRPNKQRELLLEGEILNNWIYSRIIHEEVPAFKSRFYRGKNGKLFRSCHYDSHLRSHVVDTFRVIFKRGKVVGWEELEY